VVDRPPDRREREIGVRQAIEVEQPDCFTLRTRRNLWSQQPCTKEQLQLTNVIEAVDGEEIDDLEARARLFPATVDRVVSWSSDLGDSAAAVVASGVRGWQP